jgi:hypothetical protein
MAAAEVENPGKTEDDTIYLWLQDVESFESPLGSLSR